MLTYSIDPGPPIVLVCLQGYILKDFFVVSAFEAIKDKVGEGRVTTCTKGRIARFIAPDELLNKELRRHIELSDTDIARFYRKGHFQEMVEVTATVQAREDVLNTLSLLQKIGKDPDFVDVDLNALYRIFQFSYPGREGYLLCDIKENTLNLVYDGYYGEYIPVKDTVQNELEKRITHFGNIKGIMVTGEVERALGLEEELGISVEILRPLRRIYPLNSNAVEKSNYLSTALGLAI
ncbi:hypothetical protein CH333_04370 [candidate division WOR-3 bacterium JGI_Cruoil_03_44_89]|uniref:Uncharacterized protein n=1 Tax=candidate division WOR-3 bacterium JGI_Cruoil_03_44_89 TaxID=1973748 RepID=A0A235BV41_UNCW3|nr:MAG: hypothetical protein CH333_04370 [candidate division WOR-3 bacterium JGI_Cruoil_03_44_89]